MKHLKPLKLIIEKQMKLFPDYEKEHPDSPEEIGMKYLKDRETKHTEKSGDINTWSEGIDYISNDHNKKTAIDEVIREDDHIEEDMIGKLNYGFDFLKNLLSDYISEEPEYSFEDDFEGWEDLDNWDDAMVYLDDNNIDADNEFINDFLLYLSDNNYYDEIIDMDYHNNVGYWIRGNFTEDETDNRYVYRAMTIGGKLSDLGFINEKGVGIYWSYISDGAEAHGGGSDHNEIILKASVEPEDVNWESTLYKSLYGLKEEKEIELNENSTIEIHSFKIDSSHPLVDKLYKKDIEYLETIGIDNPYRIAKKKGSIILEFEEPIIVKA